MHSYMKHMHHNTKSLIISTVIGISSILLLVLTLILAVSFSTSGALQNVHTQLIKLVTICLGPMRCAKDKVEGTTQIYGSSILC
jgi:uncharacterized protein YggT (Ycf19 family)